MPKGARLLRRFEVPLGDDSAAGVSYVVELPTVLWTKETRAWCKLPYHRHPKGCPNFGHRAGCPPGKYPWLPDVLDLDKPVYAIVTEFPLGAWARHMKERHSEWSERQCRCLLYWQGTARKEDNIALELAAEEYGFEVLADELHGVDFTKTLAGAGVRLEWPPGETTLRVSVCGFAPKRGR